MGSIELTASIFDKPEVLKKARGNSSHHGFINEPRGGPIDEVVVQVYRAPLSYTGQDSVEISCHGSLPGIAAILEAMKKVGFRDAEPGEYTLRAFLNQKMDLTRAEAVREIVEAKSRTAHDLALGRLSGALETRIEVLKRNVVLMLSHAELLLDYPEDELDEAQDIDTEILSSTISAIDDLLATYGTGRLYQEGVKVAITGKTNAGKSSLFNLFLREDRSIVSELHGTTRDYIESWITMDGIPVCLFDTAGLRPSNSGVEREGIRRTAEIVRNADVVVYLVDGPVGVLDEDREFLVRPDITHRSIAVWNKIDITESVAPDGFIGLSTVTGEGFGDLEAALAHQIGAPDLRGGWDGMDWCPGTRPGNPAVIDSVRQKEHLESALRSLMHVREGIDCQMPTDALATDLRDALDAFGELTGEVTTQDILDVMFSQFCVGK